MSLLLNSEKALTFDAITYTGTGASQDIVTGIASVGFTVASNGSGYYLDRSTFEVKNDAGAVQASGTCVCSVSKVHIKSRSQVYENTIIDGLRGGDNRVYSDTTDAEKTSTYIESFNSNGFTIYTANRINTDGATYISYQTLYTHIKWGTTNQGKKYVEAYNKSTKETMIMYEGSGTAGHEIPHSLGVALDYCDIKSLTSTTEWYIEAIDQYLHYDDGVGAVNDFISLESGNVLFGDIYGNQVSNTHILYGKAKSTTWTIVEYVGTGVAGNFVETLDVNGVGQMPRRVITKATSAVGSWALQDTERGFNYELFLNLSDDEINLDWGTVTATGFTLNTTNTTVNGDGVSYIALVEFDTNADNGGSFADTQPSKIMIGGVKANKVMLGTTQVF